MGILSHTLSLLWNNKKLLTSYVFASLALLLVNGVFSRVAYDPYTIRTTFGSIGVLSTALFAVLNTYLLIGLLHGLQEDNATWFTVLKPGWKAVFSALLFVAFFFLVALFLGVVASWLETYSFTQRFVVTVLFALVGFWLMVRLTPLFPAIVQGNGPITAVQKSFRSTKGRFWNVLGSHIVVGFTLGCITMLMYATVIGVALTSIVAPAVVTVSLSLLTYTLFTCLMQYVLAAFVTAVYFT